jgi:hypothetical protein
MRLLIALMVSVALGLTTVVADEVAGGLSQTGGSRALSMVLNAGSTWAILAILTGWWLRRPVLGAVGATVALGVATVAYYVGSIGFGDRIELGLEDVASAGGRWMAVACVFGPALGFVGVLMRSPGPLGAAACWAPLVGTALELSVRNQLNRRTFELDPWLSWAQVGMLCAAALLGVVLVRHRARKRSLAA